MTEAEKANNAEALVGNIVSGLQGMVDVLNAMPDGVKRVIMIVALLAAALGPVLIIIGKTLSAIGTIMTWAPKLAGAISAVKGAFAALSATMMANTIRSHLHFSVPDEGPPTDFESWMPDFMSGLAEGIEKSKGMVKAAVNSVATDMVVSPQMAVADSGVMTGTGTSGGADLTAGIVAALKDVLGDQKERQGDLVRHGVAQIPVSFSVTAKWLKKLAGYAKLDKISVQYFDVETAELKLAEMYVTGYKAKLKKDTSYKGLWTVSFMLKEM